MSSLLILLGLMGLVPSQNGETTYYMSLFAFEGVPNRPRFAHTFATFAAVRGDKVEVKTISWLPESGNVFLLRRREPGKNFTLKETLELATEHHARVFQWGPYRIKPELYEKAVKQVELLESGKVAYKALDELPRPDRAVNCIHAVSDVDTGAGLLETGRAYGEAASAMVVKHLRRWLIDPTKRYEDLNARLGIPKQTKLIERSLDTPESPRLPE